MTNSMYRLLLLLALLLAFGCGKSGGGGPDEDLCDEFSKKVSDCLDFDKGESSRADQCVDDLQEARELDGKACYKAEFAAFECINKETCTNVFEFLDLKANEVSSLTYCVTEIQTAVARCPLSIQLP